jgi:hypothetical protein
LVLPYETLARLQGFFEWAYILLYTLADALRVLLRYVVSTPAGIACIGAAIIAVPISLIGTRLVAKRLAANRTG